MGQATPHAPLVGPCGARAQPRGTAVRGGLGPRYSRTWAYRAWGHIPSRGRAGGDAAAFEDGGGFELVGQHAGGEQPGHAPADDHRVTAAGPRRGRGPHEDVRIHGWDALSAVRVAGRPSPPACSRPSTQSFRACDRQGEFFRGGLEALRRVARKRRRRGKESIRIRRDVVDPLIRPSSPRRDIRARQRAVPRSSPPPESGDPPVRDREESPVLGNVDTRRRLSGPEAPAAAESCLRRRRVAESPARAP